MRRRARDVRPSLPALLSLKLAGVYGPSRPKRRTMNTHTNASSKPTHGQMLLRRAEKFRRCVEKIENILSADPVKFRLG